jgi:hypothetical protein
MQRHTGSGFQSKPATKRTARKGAATEQGKHKVRPETTVWQAMSTFEFKTMPNLSRATRKLNTHKPQCSLMSCTVSEAKAQSTQTKRSLWQKRTDRAAEALRPTKAFPVSKVST